MNIIRGDISTLEQDAQYILELITKVRNHYGKSTWIIVGEVGLIIEGFNEFICTDLANNPKSTEPYLILDIVFEGKSIKNIRIEARNNGRSRYRDLGECFELLDEKLKPLFVYHFDIFEKYCG